MGIMLIKIYKRLASTLKKMIWKTLYCSKIKLGGLTSIYYPSTRITIDQNGRLRVGKGCFFNHGCSINCLGLIDIGDKCIFGEDVKIYDHNHNSKNTNKPVKEQGYEIGKVSIGDNCWIGSNVVILQNVNIGKNVIVGAGAIVTKDIPDNTILIDKKDEKRYER